MSSGKGRTVRISLVTQRGVQREVHAGDDSVTIYCEYEGRQVIVMPDVRGFRLSVKALPDDPLKSPDLIVDLLDDGSLVVRNDERLAVLQEHAGMVTVTPVKEGVA